MKKRKNLWIMTLAIAIVAGVAFMCIRFSGNTLAKAAEEQKNTLTTEKQAIQSFETSSDPGQAESTTAPALPSGVPDNSKLSERLESAGASVEILNAVSDNPIPEEAVKELNSMLDKYEKAPEGSDEQLDCLKQINEYGIIGVNESLSGEITKAKAIELTKDTFKAMFDIDISNWVNQIRTRYFAKGVAAANNGRSSWNIQGATDKVSYYIIIDAQTSEVIGANWVLKSEPENAGLTVEAPSQNQLQTCSNTSQVFVEKNLLKKNTTILQCPPMASSESSTYKGNPMFELTAWTDVAVSDGTIIHVGVNFETNRVISFSKTMAWEK